jgi:putative radical SAM enzyme (TIGR03279 family)
MVRIAEVESGSIADELELEIGSRIIRINGSRVRDNIDLTFLLSDDELEIEVSTPDGEALVYDILKEPGESVGIVPAPDTIRECANKCVFCFIDGNPPDVRSSLWLRDDDFRLSFTYGSYVTLTNLGPRGLERLVEQRLSPLYVSVHATEPQVRIDLLKNERAGLIMDHLRYFGENGLEVHTQVVLCPEWNDEEHLERTIEDLWSLGESILSLSVVPVGLTRYNLNRPVRLLTPDEAARAIDQVERARLRGLRERGRGWCYVGDEMFLIAGRELPDPSYYDDAALLENGVGAVRHFLDDLDDGLTALPRLPGRRVRILTGSSMGPFLSERADALARATGAEVRVEVVPNEFYGEVVTTAGLMAGRDILAHVQGTIEARDLVLLPAEALNGDELFIDSLPLSELREALAPARVEAGHELTELLRRAGAAAAA